MLIFTMMVLALLACDSLAAPMPSSIETPQPVYAAAQSTLDYGQSQMKELSHQATVVSLNMDQAANAAEQATLDYNQRQMMELAYQATAVSLNMAQAAATQQFIAEQTQRVVNATAIAQSQAATATYSTYILEVTQTAQAQAILDVQATENAQAVATRTAYSLTATPLAAVQAANIFQQGQYEQLSLWRGAVTPLVIILSTLIVLLLIAGCVLAFHRLMPVLEFRLRNPRENSRISALLLVDGRIVDPDPNHRQLKQRELSPLKHPRLPSDGSVQVEIIGPSEPSITQWITEAEQELRTDGRIQP